MSYGTRQLPLPGLENRKPTIASMRETIRRRLLDYALRQAAREAKRRRKRERLAKGAAC
jgi:hypothetical protein